MCAVHTFPAAEVVSGRRDGFKGKGYSAKVCAGPGVGCGVRAACGAQGQGVQPDVPATGIRYVKVNAVVGPQLKKPSQMLTLMGRAPAGKCDHVIHAGMPASQTAGLAPAMNVTGHFGFDGVFAGVDEARCSGGLECGVQQVAETDDKLRAEPGVFKHGS